MVRASVIIVSWNGEPHLGDCLRAILTQVDPDDQVIVVDNGSADGSTTLIRQQFPQVHLIESERHLGLAGGYNAGLRAARGEYLLLVSQDVTVQAGWLEKMVEALTPAEVGVAGCKLLHPDGTIQQAGGITSYPLALPGHHETDEGQRDTRREVDYVTDAAMGLKRTMLNEIGPFDEGFFPACYEETDLCFRARAAGYQVIYTPEATGVHHETTAVKLPGAKRGGFLREKPLGAAAPKSPALPFTPTASGGVLWLFPIELLKIVSCPDRRHKSSSNQLLDNEPIIYII